MAKSEKLKFGFVVYLAADMGKLLDKHDDPATWLIISQNLKPIEFVTDKWEKGLNEIREKNYARDESGQLLYRAVLCRDSDGEVLKETKIVDGREVETVMTESAPYIDNLIKFNEDVQALYDTEMTVKWDFQMPFADMEVFPSQFRKLQHHLIDRIFTL